MSKLKSLLAKWIQDIESTDTWDTSTGLPNGGASVFQFLLDSRDENGERFYLDTDGNGEVFRVYPERHV